MSGLPVIDLHHAQHLTWLLLHSCCQQKHCLVESDDCHIHSFLLLENVETTDNETAFHGNKAMAVTRIEPGRMIQNNQTRFSLRKVDYPCSRDSCFPGPFFFSHQPPTDAICLWIQKSLSARPSHHLLLLRSNKVGDICTDFIIIVVDIKAQQPHQHVPAVIISSSITHSQFSCSLVQCVVVTFGHNLSIPDT